MINKSSVHEIHVPGMFLQNINLLLKLLKEKFMKLTILIVRFLEELNSMVYFGGLCYLTIRVLSLSILPNYTALSHVLKIMLKYVLGWISRSHEMNPSMKPGASKQTQRRMEGLSSWRDGPPFCLLFLVRSPAKC